jgi:hypothetical protein
MWTPVTAAFVASGASGLIVRSGARPAGELLWPV